MSEKPWKQCELCPNETFSSPLQFGNHLRLCHSRVEGGSHVCLFGPNSMCPLLPYEGVSDRDFETHIAKCHIFLNSTNNYVSKVEHHYRKATLEANSLGDQNTNFPRPSRNGFTSEQDFQYKRDRPNVIDDTEWTIYLSSQNLTSILNDPSKPRSYYDNLFSKDWGSYFVDPNYIAPYPTSKKPSHMLFERYAKQIGKRSRCLVKSELGEVCSSESRAQTLVPSIFFDDNFDLEETNNFVGLLNHFVPNRKDDSLESFFDHISMNDIQKSLSEYLDTVEQDLAQQICKRSKDFFHVMSSMDLVMEKLKVSIKQVSDIRKICKELEESLVKPIERNNELTRLRTKHHDLLKKINWIATVHQTQPTIQLLLSKNDYAGALDLISTSQEVVAQELNGVISFRYLRLQLMEIEKVIEQMMNEEFVKYLTAEWNRPITQDSNDKIQEEKLLSIIYGMLKLQNFNFIDTFREEAFTAIKTNMKQTVIETLSYEDSIEVSRIDSNLFEQLKCLTFDKWFLCLRTVFTRLVTLLRRVNLVYNVISNGFATVTNHIFSNGIHSSDSSTLSVSHEDVNLKVILPGDYYELSTNLKEILYSICDFAHSKSANIIELRVNDGSLDRLDSTEFLQLIQLIDGFTNDCEDICGKKSPNLKLVMQIQSNKFVTRFHEERKRKLRQLLDLEQWKSVNNLSDDFQQLCFDLIDIEQYSSLSKLYSNYKSAKNNSTKSTSSKSFIVVNNEKFVIVNTVINLLYLVLEYCEYAEQISFLSPDLLMRLIDLLKLFNSRTSQLVLGAEALQIAGLKTISARTLIISCRSLTFVIQFIPRIRNHFEGLLQSRNGNMLKHLEELCELYENHYSKIPEKVISLVKDVVSSYLNKWVAKAPVPSTSFQTISQHLSRLHDNIQDVLPYPQLVSLFQRIHFLVIDIFREQLLKLKIVNDGGPQHGLVTQELAFYIQSLKNLSIGKDLDLSTEDMWL